MYYRQPYPRDMTGYGRHIPNAAWPGDARIAVQFVLNYEEGGENNVLHGDEGSETFLSEIIGARAFPARHMSMETLYEYGSRAGFWRVHDLFRSRGLPLTIFGVGAALALNREAVAAMREADWEIACHGLRWIDHQFMPEDVERAQIREAIALHSEITGSPPLGWYTGRDSPNTRRLVLEHGGLLYDSDSYADDLPYWVESPAGPHLIVPYTLDTNDMRFATAQGFHNSEQFFTYLRDAFDVLYAEGATRPKMLNVGLHCRIVGRPARLRALQLFLDHIAQHDKVWICRRVDIARHWHQVHRPA